MSGRHKFEVRDMEDSLRDENVVPLSLPKLPSAFESSAPMQIVPNGLIRQTARNTTSTCTSAEDEQQKSSMEEEKLLIDSKSTEKEKLFSLAEEEQSSMSKTTDSITIKSINTSWSIAGESMAHESDLTVQRERKEQEPMSFASQDENTLNNSSITAETDAGVTLNDVHLDVLLEGESGKPPQFMSELQNYANRRNEPMLEDETSPSLSMTTSSKEEEKKDLLDDQLEDTSEPADVKSPTHTSNSNSNSISEPGRDFLIDDEIADQPELFSNYKNGKLSGVVLFYLLIGRSSCNSLTTFVNFRFCFNGASKSFKR